MLALGMTRNRLAQRILAFAGGAAAATLAVALYHLLSPIFAA